MLFRSSSQKINLIGSCIRVNCRCMCVWRLRNYKEVETLCEELSGVYGKDTLLELYKEATKEPYSFLFIRLDGKTRQEMFYLRFEQRLIPESADEESDVSGLANGGRATQPIRSNEQKAPGRASNPVDGAGKKR